MDYIKIRFSTDLDQVSRDLRRTMEDVFGSTTPLFSHASNKWKPQMDLYETADEIKIVAAMAGVSKDSLEIEINERAVKISGIRTPPAPEAKARFCLAEIQYGRFDRVLFLPQPIDTDQVSASHSAGMLQISMVKRQQPRSRKVPIRDEET
ncbi:MAG: Hsp20/alpha crystallin family protein [Desulfosudaceae bacterium]